MPKTKSVLMAGCISLFAHAWAAAPPLVVHEWGTFTSFQDANGVTIAGINVDDEPVPEFVHRLNKVPVFTNKSLPATWSQGAPRCHRAVTMRLETPVLYFYPPAGWASSPFDVRAEFQGGWLTEFYPAAKAEAGDFPKALKAGARGSLLWEQVRLDPSAESKLLDTNEHVWLAPRNVKAAIVTVAESNEAEKYLFYRGVAHLDAAVVVRERDGGWDISLRDGAGLATLPQMWIVEVMPGGKVRHQAISARGRMLHAKEFAPATANMKSSLDDLQRELARGMIAQGLYADEAAAMLATWKLSYFQSEGLRVFFMLPQSWTDAQLPLSISTPAEVTRVMVGRIELVTRRQRETLARLHALPDDAFPRYPLYVQNLSIINSRQKARNSHSALYREMGRPVPESLQLYESLGRFRDALLEHELRTANLAAERDRLWRVINAFSACLPSDTRLVAGS